MGTMSTSKIFRSFIYVCNRFFMKREKNINLRIGTVLKFV